ncbi:MAG TPA: Sec-independent protein translocase protein TatB [Nevskiales bacterium]|nr:Sec-independent protein translocase protein TatB [Nevskiales bacterium]
MFEIGFWELVLIGVVALVVLGPERLPKAARTLGLWAGRARSYVRHFSSELEREVQAQALREQARDLQRELKAPVDDTATPPNDTRRE